MLHPCKYAINILKRESRGWNLLTRSFKKKSKHQGSNRVEKAGAFPIYKKGH
jgi:hypothetical protein